MSRRGASACGSDGGGRADYLDGLGVGAAHLLSGFTMVSLGTAQYRWPVVLQISDIFGSYGVSFLIMLVAAALASLVPWGNKRRVWWPALAAASVLATTLGYGQWRLNQQTTRPGPRVALIQGSIDIDMKHDPTQSQRIFDEYFDLSERAVHEHRDLDLIVWPETMFRYPWFTFAEGVAPPPDTITAEEAMERSHRAVENTVGPLDVPVLLGIDSVHYTATDGEPLRYNTALFLDRRGQVVGRYDKCHPVMFGEYVPFADVFPWIYNLTPLYAGVAPGPGPVAVQVGDVRYSPDICYEDTVPHLIRNQVLQLRRGQRTRRAGELDQRRLVLGLERIGSAPGVRVVSRDRVPQAAVDCRQYGLFGLDRLEWADPGARPTPGQGRNLRRTGPRQPQQRVPGLWGLGRGAVSAGHLRRGAGGGT